MVIHGRQVEIHLPSRFRCKLARFETKHHKATQFHVIKQQVEVEILVAHLQMHLPTDERKTRAKLQKEFLHMRQQGIHDDRIDFLFVNEGRPVMQTFPIVAPMQTTQTARSGSMRRC